MRPWVRRKIWLAVLAFANLVVWGAAAYSVSLVASDRLDLGIESSVREVQATAIAAWNASRPGASASGAGSTGGDISGPQAQPDGSVLPAGQAALVPRPATPLPQATAAAAGAGEALPVESAAALSPESIALEPGSALAPGATGTSAVSTAPITTPLILADPPFHDLTALDRELATSAAGRTVQIRYLEASLQKEVGLLLEGRSDLPYQNVQLELRGGQLVVQGDLVLLGVPLHAQVKATLVASDCRPSVAVSSVKIGWLFTPVVVRNQVESLIGQVLEWYPEGYPLCVDRIVTQEDRVTLYGHRR